jgi:hypothetical protein
MRWTGTVSSFGLSRRVSVCAPHMGWLCGTKLQRLFVQRAHGVIECASVGGPRFDVVRPHVICIRGDGPAGVRVRGRSRTVAPGGGREYRLVLTVSHHEVAAL